MANEPYAVTAVVVRQLRRLRIQRGLSASALAEAITASGHAAGRGVITNHELGRVQAATIDFVVAAAKALGVSLAELLEDTPCEACAGAPPVGFTCNRCGSSRDA